MVIRLVTLRLPAYGRHGDDHLQVVQPAATQRVPRPGHVRQVPAVEMTRARHQPVGDARAAATRGLPDDVHASRGIFHEILQLNHPPLGVTTHERRQGRAVAFNLQILRASGGLQSADQIALFRGESRGAHRFDEHLGLCAVHLGLLEQVGQQRSQRRARGIASGGWQKRRVDRCQRHRLQSALHLQVVVGELRAGSHHVDLPHRRPVKRPVDGEQRRRVGQDVNRELLVHRERVVAHREPHPVEAAVSTSVHGGMPLIGPAIDVSSQRRPGYNLRRRVEPHERW